MKPLKGYKNVTNLFLRLPCCVEGCPRGGDIPMQYHKETDTWSQWMCAHHATKKVREDKRGDEGA